MAKPTFLFVTFLAAIIGCGAFAFADVNDGLDYSSFKAGDYFHLQGSCIRDIVAYSPVPLPKCSASYKPAHGTNLCLSTWSCHGAGSSMLKAKYMNGLMVCAYIDNNGSQGYFVPMNTAEEWLAFNDPNHTPPDVRIVAGCPGGVVRLCGKKYLLPDTRVSDDPAQTFHFQVTDEYAVDWSCPATVKTVDSSGALRNEPVRHCGKWQHIETGTCTHQPLP